MSTVDLPFTRVTVASLRRVNVPTFLVVVAIVLVVLATGLGVHSRDQAGRQADRIEQREVAQRVEAVRADRRADEAFFVASGRSARSAHLSAVAAERAALAANRDAALTSAAAALASSAGRVDELQRGELQAAVDVLSAPESVYSRVTAATADVVRLADQVGTAEAAWSAEQAALVQTSGAGGGSSSVGASVRDVGEAELRSLPGSAGVSIRWDDPGLSGHLGGVWSGSTDAIMISASQLAGNPGKTRDVVRHEIAHIYEGRIAATHGLTWNELGARMSGAFGASPQEKAADCVALRFGAAWTHYTSDCAGSDKQTWVDALIGGYLP
ncbi:hypothetical protein [Cellulomonas sp. URHE0023]|uniref:hypothetical protein n=1 Tax=Cellulomonas sp. URHE0023 TaxID=1380354 RepID=UPI000480E5E2|nr:hypothetical protein [Cellulomonas sp. URHE0023]